MIATQKQEGRLVIFRDFWGLDPRISQVRRYKDLDQYIGKLKIKVITFISFFMYFVCEKYIFETSSTHEFSVRTFKICPDRK